MAQEAREVREFPAKRALQEIFSAMIDEGLLKPGVVERVEVWFGEKGAEAYIWTKRAYVSLAYHPTRENYEAEASSTVNGCHDCLPEYVPLRFEFAAKGGTAREAIEALRKAVEEEAPRVAQAIEALRRAAEEGGTIDIIDAAHATAEALREIEDLLGVD